MSNIKYLAFDTPKKSHMRCSICQNIWHGWIIQSQIWKYMDKNCKIFIVFLISFSLSSLITQISSSLLLKKRSLPLSFSLNLSSFLLSLLMLLLSSSQPHNAANLPLAMGFFFVALIWWVGLAVGGFKCWCVGSYGDGWWIGGGWVSG